MAKQLILSMRTQEQEQRVIWAMIDAGLTEKVLDYVYYHLWSGNLDLL